MIPFIFFVSKLLDVLVNEGEEEAGKKCVQNAMNQPYSTSCKLESLSTL